MPRTLFAVVGMVAVAVACGGRLAEEGEESDRADGKGFDVPTATPTEPTEAAEDDGARAIARPMHLSEALVGSGAGVTCTTKRTYPGCSVVTTVEPNVGFWRVAPLGQGNPDRGISSSSAGMRAFFNFAPESRPYFEATDATFTAYRSIDPVGMGRISRSGSVLAVTMSAGRGTVQGCSTPYVSVVCHGATTLDGPLPVVPPPPPDAGPTDPGPTDPGPTDPGPTDPGPTDPGPTDPGPTDPGPTDPGPQDAGSSAPPVDAGAADAAVTGVSCTVSRTGADCVVRTTIEPAVQFLYVVAPIGGGNDWKGGISTKSPGISALFNYPADGKRAFWTATNATYSVYKGPIGYGPDYGTGYVNGTVLRFSMSSGRGRILQCTTPLITVSCSGTTRMPSRP